MAELFIGAFGIVLLLLLLQRMESVEKNILIKTLKWTFVGVLVLAGFYLILVGRLLHVAAIIVLLVLLLRADAHKWMKKKRAPLALSPPLTPKEAADLLQVQINATPLEIHEAFEHMEGKDSTHRDRLIQARDVLLKNKKRRSS